VTVTGTSVTAGRPAALPIAAADVGSSGGNWAANSAHTLFVILEAPHAAGQTFRVLLGR